MICMHVSTASYMCFNCTGNQDLLGGLEYQLGQLQLAEGIPMLFPVQLQLPPVLQLPNQVYS